MAKYDPLEMHLLCVPHSQDTLSLSFEELEAIIEAKLPPSAYKHRAWWANDRHGRHVHARAWSDIGWQVQAVDLGERWVRFERE